MEEKDNLQEDITKTGYLNYADLQKLNNGTIPPTYSYDQDLNPIRPLTIDESSKLQSQYNLYRLSNIRDFIKPSAENSSIIDMSQLPLLDSKYDRSWAPYKDIEENRAQQQSAGRQLFNGIAKMGELALSTAADNIVGSVAGVANVISEAAQGNISKEHLFRDSLNAFVDNPVSRKLQEINKWTEEVLPNYYSKTQLNRSWYQNLFTANFIGDHFLKNTGFMIGALMGAKVIGGAVSKLMGIENSRNIFRGMAAAAGMNDMTSAQVAAQLAREGATANQVTQALAQSAKKLSRQETALKLIAGLGGSWGESRVEALNGADEMFDKYSGQFNLEKEQQMSQIDQQLMEENPNLFVLQPQYNTEGQLLGYNVVPDRTNPEYGKAYNRKVDAIQEDYKRKMEELTNRKIEYANNSFLVNFALTYLENITVFGDAITGGYTSAKNSKLLTKKLGQKIGATPIENTMRQQSQELLKKETRKNIARGIWSPIFEGTQEMWQRGEQLGEEMYQMSKFNTFAGEGTDLEGVDKTTSWIEAFIKGLGQTYSNADEWENFALGFFTSMIPMGHAEVRRNPQTGKIEYDDNGRQLVDRSIWGGTFWDNILWANKQLRTDASEQERAINDVLQDANKSNIFQSLVRDEVFAQRRNQALEEGNIHNYKSAEFDKFINMALTFQKQGLQEDFRDLVETYYTIETPEQVDDLRKNTIVSDEKESISFYDGWSDQEIIDYFAKAKDNAIKTAENVNAIAKDFDILFGDRVNDQLKTEMIVSTLRIDDREKRIKQITQEIIDSIKEKTGIVNDIQGNLSEELSFLEKVKSLPRLLDAFDDETVDKINDKIINGGNTLQQAIDKFVKEELNTLNSKRSQTGKKIKALERKQKAGTITDSEINELENLRNQQADSKITYYELTQHLQKLQESALPITFDVRKIEDLRDLIAEREGLITEYYYFGNQTKAFPFETFFANDIAKSLNSYMERKAQKAYSEYKDTRNASLLNKWQVSANQMLSLAENLKDESTASYLRAAIKYNDYLNPQNIEKNKKIPLGDVSNDAIDFLYNYIQESLVEKNDEDGFIAVDDETAKSQVQKGMDNAITQAALYAITQGKQDLLQKVDNLVKGIKAQEAYDENLKKQQQQKTDSKKKETKEEKENEVETELEGGQKEFAKKSEKETIDELQPLNTWPDIARWLSVYDIFSPLIKRYVYEDTDDNRELSQDDFDAGFSKIMQDFQGNPAESKVKIESIVLDLHRKLSNSKAGNTGKSSTVKKEEEVTSDEVEELFPDEEEYQEKEDNEGKTEIISDEIEETPQEFEKQDEDIADVGGVSTYNDDTRNVAPTVSNQSQQGNVPPMTTGTQLISTNQGNSNAENNHFPQTPLGQEDALSVGRVETLYDIEGLKEGKAIPRSSKFGFDQGQGIWTTKGREFVENGDLNRLQEYWAKEYNGQKLPIRLVRIHHSGNFEGNVAAMNTFYRDVLFAAVEIPDGFKLTDMPNPKSYNGKTEYFTTVTKEGGQQTSMLILGIITASKKNQQLQNALEILNDSKIEGQKGKPKKGVVNQAYDTQLKLLKKSYPDAGIQRLHYFSPSITLDLEWIFSGRIIKSNERNPEVKERDFVTEGFQDCVLTEKEYKQLDDKYTPFEIAIIAASEITFGNIEKTEDTVTVPPNTFRYQFYNSLQYSKANNQGTIWIKTKEADGRIYYKGVKLKSFDSSYAVDFDQATQENSPIAARLKQAIINMVETNRNHDGGTIEDWKQQLAQLQKYIYVPKTQGKRMFISKEGFSITKGGRKISFDEEDAAKQIYERIRSVGYTFTLGLDQKLTLKQIIDSNVLTTDLAQIHNAGASFLVSSVTSKRGVVTTVPSQMAQDLREGKITSTGLSRYDPTKGQLSYIKVNAPEMGNNQYYVTFDEKGNRVWFIQKGERHQYGRDEQVTDDVDIAILNQALEIHNIKYNAQRSTVNRLGMIYNIVNQRNLYKDIRYKIAKGKKTGTDSQIYFSFQLGGNTAYMDLDFKVYSPGSGPEYTAIQNLSTNPKEALELLSESQGKKALNWNKGVVVDEDSEEELDTEENVYKIAFKRKDEKTGGWRRTYIDILPEDLNIDEEWMRSVLGNDYSDDVIKETLKQFKQAPRIRVMALYYNKDSNQMFADIRLYQEDGRTRYKVDGDTFLYQNGIDATFEYVTDNEDNRVPINLESKSSVKLKDIISQGSKPFKYDWTPGEISKEDESDSVEGKPKQQKRTKQNLDNVENASQDTPVSLWGAFGEQPKGVVEDTPVQPSGKEASESPGSKSSEIVSSFDEDPLLNGILPDSGSVEQSTTIQYEDGGAIDVPERLINVVAEGNMAEEEVIDLMLQQDKKGKVQEAIRLFNEGSEQEAINLLKDTLFC